MTTLLINSGALNWTVVLDNQATPAADLLQALVAGRALDEADARPVDGPMQLSIDRPTLAPSVDGDGMFGWSGVPRAVWGGNAAMALACRGSVEATWSRRSISAVSSCTVFRLGSGAGRLPRTAHRARSRRSTCPASASRLRLHR
jgi:hypothetical protein